MWTMQLNCHDASLAIKHVFDHFQSVIITYGTLSQIDLYPRLLHFNHVISHSFTLSMTKDLYVPWFRLMEGMAYNSIVKHLSDSDTIVS
ncbi:DNA repair helicase XPD [Iris pallida]|uniref:DNA repair helicase XPD n=1 Tax=Iris pallida TaxID=29817 RepID=A0AAX6ES32_IRIPA|nr:DNA repair helicase XPD [Iris pallida]